MEISVRRIDFMDVCVKYPLTILLPFQGVVALPLLPRAPLRLPWAMELLGFQPVLSLPCVLCELFSARFRSAVRSLRAVFSPFSVCRALSASCFQPVFGLPCVLCELFSARSRSAVRSQRAVFSPFSVCRALSASCFQPVPGLPCPFLPRLPHFTSQMSLVSRSSWKEW